MSEAPAMTRDELIAAIESGWDALNAYLATLTAAQVTGPTDAAGWTVKDHLAHLAVWEDSMNALLEKKHRREYMGIPAEIWDTRDFDQINAVIQARYHDMPLREVQAMYFGVHGRLVDHLKTLADEDLQRPFSAYQPGSSSSNPILVVLKGDTFEHYAQHIPWMDAIVNGQKPTVSRLLADINAGWEKLQTYLGTLSDEQATVPTDAAGWTVKDHLAHLLVWEDGMNALLAYQPRDEYMGIPPALLANGSYTLINEILRAPDQDAPLSEIKARFADVHARLLAKLQTLADADLQQPYNHYNPGSTRTDPVINAISGNTYAHYPEHQEWMAAIASRQPFTLAAVLAPIQSGWDEMQGYLSSLTYEQVMQPTDAAGWTIKDNLTHLATWEDGINALLDGQPRYQRMGVPQEVWETGDWDAVNEVIRQRFIDLPLREVAGMFFGIHDTLVAKLNALTVDDLLRPYSDYQPGSPWDAPVIKWVRLNTFEHFAEHTLWMDRITRKQTISVPNLLASIGQGWDALNAYLATLSEAQLFGKTDPAGWTVKDHVIHLATWEDTLNTVLDHGDVLAVMGIDRATWDTDHPNGMNAVIQQRYKDLSWAEVQARRQEIHDRLLGKVQALSDADLLRPHSDFQPDSTSTEPILSYFAGNTFGHYAEHLPWIKGIADQPDAPATVPDVLARIGQGWDELNAYLATLSEAQLTQPTDAGGWTIKDHVIHLSIWEDGIFALLERLMRVQYMGIDEATWETGDDDRINAIIQARYQDLTWAQVDERRQHIHRRLVDKIASLTDEDLQRPYRYYELASMEDRPVIRWIISNTYPHYAQHLPWIRKIVQG